MFVYAAENNPLEKIKIRDKLMELVAGGRKEILSDYTVLVLTGKVNRVLEGEGREWFAEGHQVQSVLNSAYLSLKSLLILVIILYL